MGAYFGTKKRAPMARATASSASGSEPVHTGDRKTMGTGEHDMISGSTSAKPETPQLEDHAERTTGTECEARNVVAMPTSQASALPANLYKWLDPEPEEMPQIEHDSTINSRLGAGIDLRDRRRRGRPSKVGRGSSSPFLAPGGIAGPDYRANLKQQLLSIVKTELGSHEVEDAKALDEDWIELHKEECDDLPSPQVDGKSTWEEGACQSVSWGGPPGG